MMQRIYLSASIAIAAGILLLLSPAQAVPVPGGQLTTFTGDVLWQPAKDVISASDTDSNKVVELLFDAGSSSAGKITQLMFKNRSITTNAVPRDMKIYVSSKDGREGFDPKKRSDYDTLVYTGIPEPNSREANEIRKAVLTNPSEKRYYAISITSNFWGELSPKNTIIQFATGGRID